MKQKSTFFAPAIFSNFNKLHPKISLSKFRKDFHKTTLDTSFYLKFALRFQALNTQEWKQVEKYLSNLWDYHAVVLNAMVEISLDTKVLSGGLAYKNKLKVA